MVACCFSPCGQMFVTGCTHGDLKLWDADVNLLSSERDAHDLGVTCCCFAPQFNVGECFAFCFFLQSSCPGVQINNLTDKLIHTYEDFCWLIGKTGAVVISVQFPNVAAESCRKFGSKKESEIKYCVPVFYFALLIIQQRSNRTHSCGFPVLL